MGFLIAFVKLASVPILGERFPERLLDLGRMSAAATWCSLRPQGDPVPANIKVIQATEFVRATPEGKAYIEKAEALLKAIADASAGLEGFHVLVDTRRVTGALTASELWYLADKLARYRRTFGNKTAILCPVERFDHSRFFAMCAENKGFNVQSFTSYEDAMEWLLAVDEAPLEPRTEVH
jgi:hypothetical protein